MGDLSRQVAVVTGAGSGIGKAIAVAVARAGGTVCLLGRTRRKLDAVAASLVGGAHHAVFGVDLCRDDQVDAAKREVEARFGRVDLLVLCAGEIARGGIRTAPVESFDSLYRTNVRGNYRLIQQVLPLVRVGPGQIVVINSSAALSARPNVGQYCAVQHALKAMTDALRAEVNSEGIRVLSIYPGRTATPLQERLYADDGAHYVPERLLQPEDIASVVVHSATLPRTAEITDISIRPLLKSY